MSNDEALLERVRALLADERQVAEKAMFGRRMFMVAGNLAVGVAGDELIVRVGGDAQREAVARPHARPCVMSGRPMHGWVLVGGDGVLADGLLATWVRRGVAYARSRAS